MQLMHLPVLIFFHVFAYLVGKSILRRWFGRFPTLLTVTGSLLLGITVGVPTAYFLSTLFVKSGEPIFWGTLTACIVMFAGQVGLRSRPGKAAAKNEQNFSVSDATLLVFSLGFSSWLMFKTFRTGAAGTLFVGSNNIFDFGHVIGLMRSMSWGSNIPFASPFFAGLPFFYHFFFAFWTAMWEYFGVPTMWAFNIPSIYSFSALLIMVYFLAQSLIKQSVLVGWLAVLLTITNSSLTFWHLLIQKGLNVSFIREMWLLPKYPFAGPFDGSAITIYMTLNNYINQRHLGFAIACGYLLFLILERLVSKNQLRPVQSIVIGVFTGLLFFWNVAIWALVVALLSLYLLFTKQWKAVFIYVFFSVLIAFLTALPIVNALYASFVFVRRLTGVVGGVGRAAPTWSMWEYFWQNLGLLPMVAAAGFVLLPKKLRVPLVPILILFIGQCALVVVKKDGFEQKFLSFFLIGINVLAAGALLWLWNKKLAILRLFAITLFFILSVSGVVDLMPIKNEFAYPLVGNETVPVISWIKNNTPRDAVFISYLDMIDPVVLAGRKNFFGFFGNVGWYDRSRIVDSVYWGDPLLAKKNGISFILAPKWQKSDFPYTLDWTRLSEAYRLEYEDEKYRVFAVN